MSDGVSRRGGRPVEFHSYGTWMNNPAGTRISSGINYRWDFLNNHRAELPIFRTNLNINFNTGFSFNPWGILCGNIANIGIQGLFLWGATRLFRRPIINQQQLFLNYGAYNNGFNTGFGLNAPFVASVGLGAGAAQQNTTVQQSNTTQQTTTVQQSTPSSGSTQTSESTPPSRSTQNSGSTSTENTTVPSSTGYACASNKKATYDTSGDAAILGNDRIDANGQSNAEGQFPKKFTITDTSSGNTHVYTYTFVGFSQNNKKVLYLSESGAIGVAERNKEAVKGKPVIYEIPIDEFKDGKFADGNIEKGNMTAVSGTNWVNFHYDKFDKNATTTTTYNAVKGSGGNKEWKV